MDNTSDAPVQGKIRVLHVDDEQDQLSFTRILLEDADPAIVVESIPTPDEALDRLSTHPDCVITDYQMPGMDGIELARRIKSVVDIPVILYTGRGSEEVASAAFAAGVSDYLRKEMDPGHFQVLARRIRQAVESWRTERILHESEEKYRQLAENAADVLLTIDLNGVVTYSSRDLRPYIGFSREELVGRRVLDFISPEHREAFLNQFNEILKGNRAWVPVVFPIRTKDGGIVTLEFNPSPIMDGGILTGIQVVSHDISTHMRQEKKLKALHASALSLAKAETIDDVWKRALEGLHDGLGFNSITLGLVEGENIRFHRAIGTSISPDLTVPLDNSILAEVVRSGRSVVIPDTRLDPNYFTVLKNQDGSNRNLSELAAPIVVDGSVIAVLNSESERPNEYGPEDKMLIETMASHVSNAVARVRIMEGLQRKVDQRTSELLAAEQMAAAGRVSAMVAHDLRGPLQTISNASQLVKRRPERAAEMIAVINSAVERSLHMIEDLRLNTREDPLKLAQTDLAALIAESLKELSPPRGVEIDLRLGEGLGGVMVDPLKVNRVLDNLLRNAVEAMPGGGKLTVTAGAVSGEIVLEVADTGVGIPEETRARLFRPFVTTKAGGLGLGLPYCKKAVEAHGGSISVYSTPGSGTTFTIRLPLR